jgi:SNF2 family DNA or RNA helicase
MINHRVNYDFLKHQMPNPATPLLDKMGIDMGFFSGFPPLKTKYIDHQLISLYIATQQPYYLFALKMALGKTWIASQTIRYHHFVSKKWEGGKVLFVCPKPLNCISIAKDFDQFIPDLNYQIISKEHGWDGNLKFDADILLIHSGYLAHSAFLGADLEPTPGKRKSFSLKAQGDTRKDKNADRVEKRAFIQEQVQKIVQDNNIKAVFYDEIHTFKNIQGVWFEVAKTFSDLIEYRYGLSGTPTSEKITEVWPIARLVDRGETFGDNEWRFKNKYFRKEKEGFWGSTFVPRDGSLSAIRDKLATFSISFTKQEVGLYVPPIKILRQDFELGAGAKNMYKSIEAGNRKLIAASTLSGQAIGGNLELKTNYTKLRQICSGTLIVHSDVKGEPSTVITFEDNRKAKDHAKFLRRVKSQTVTFYDFTGSHLAAINECAKYGITFGVINGNVKPKDKERILREFLRGDIQHLLIQYLSGQAGLNLQVAQYIYCLDVPQAIITLQQVRDRIARPGQRHENIAMIIPCAKGTLEQRVADKLQNAGRVVDYLYGSEDAEVSEEEAQAALLDVLNNRSIQRHKDYEFHPVLKAFNKKLASTPTTEGKWNVYVNKSPIYEVVITFFRGGTLWIRDSSDTVCPIAHYPNVEYCEWEPHSDFSLDELSDED